MFNGALFNRAGGEIFLEFLKIFEGPGTVGTAPSAPGADAVGIFEGFPDSFRPVVPDSGGLNSPGGSPVGPQDASPAPPGAAPSPAGVVHALTPPLSALTQKSPTTVTPTPEELLHQNANTINAMGAALTMMRRCRRTAQPRAAQVPHRGIQDVMQGAETALGPKFATNAINKASWWLFKGGTKYRERMSVWSNEVDALQFGLMHGSVALMAKQLRSCAPF